MNDVLHDLCNADQVVAGIYAIVQELQLQRPDAWIVIQSLLPPPAGSITSTTTNVIDTINQATECMTHAIPQIFYYNSSRVFVVDENNDHNVAGSRLVSNDGIHPNVQGAQAWAMDMLSFVRSLYHNYYPIP
jgi:lysophospholipase L1-like esterase